MGSCYGTHNEYRDMAVAIYRGGIGSGSDYKGVEPGQLLDGDASGQSTGDSGSKDSDDSSSGSGDTGSTGGSDSSGDSGSETKDVS
jgi:hypothetical protein